MTAPRRRGPRRADAPGTGPASADGPEPTLPGRRGRRDAPARGEGARGTGASRAGEAGAVVGKDTGPDRRPAGRPGEPTDALGRWLLEQRPPHWG